MTIETNINNAAVTHEILHSPDGLLWCDSVVIDPDKQTATLLKNGVPLVTFKAVDVLQPGERLTVQLRAGFRLDTA